MQVELDADNWMSFNMTILISGWLLNWEKKQAWANTENTFYSKSYFTMI